MVKGGMKVPDEKKVFINIYCKIYTDNFSDEMVNRKATGKEIYNFLTKDAGLSVDENGELIPGDCNIWYLGCNDKFGCLRYKDTFLSWDFGESSFAIVEAFITLIYIDKVFTQEEYQVLMEKSKEGRLFDNMYDIPRYLKAKCEGRPWAKTKEAREFRLKAMRFAARVNDHLQKENFLFVDPVLRW
jgi:hypothetical protein